MAYDGKALHAALDRHKQLVGEHERILTERRRSLHSLIPRLSEISAELSSSVIACIKLSLETDTDAEERMEQIKLDNLKLQEERGLILADHGFPPDYLSTTYRCPKCADSGFIEREMCDCLKALYKEELSRELSMTMGTTGVDLSSVDLSIYSDKPYPKISTSPRDNMRYILDTCRRFISEFNYSKQNLLFTGASGTGKTHIAGCVAHEAVGLMKSVVYESACILFTKFDEERFRTYNDESKADMRRYSDCDLLILDDLGQEAPSPYAVSKLYSLINSRLLTGQHTIVITSLGNDEFKRKYGMSIASRILNSYTSLYFFGEDLRRGM